MPSFGDITDGVKSVIVWPFKVVGSAIGGIVRGFTGTTGIDAVAGRVDETAQNILNAVNQHAIELRQEARDGARIVRDDVADALRIVRQDGRDIAVGAANGVRNAYIDVREGVRVVHLEMIDGAQRVYNDIGGVARLLRQDVHEVAAIANGYGMGVVQRAEGMLSIAASGVGSLTTGAALYVFNQSCPVNNPNCHPIAENLLVGAGTFMVGCMAYSSYQYARQRMDQINELVGPRRAPFLPPAANAELPEFQGHGAAEAFAAPDMPRVLEAAAPSAPSEPEKPSIGPDELIEKEDADDDIYQGDVLPPAVQATLAPVAPSASSSSSMSFEEFVANIDANRERQESIQEEINQLKTRLKQNKTTANK